MYKSVTTELKMDHEWDHLKLKVKQCLKKDQKCNQGSVHKSGYSEGRCKPLHLRL